jgi:RHS repeat-associated protein
MEDRKLRMGDGVMTNAHRFPSLGLFITALMFMSCGGPSHSNKLGARSSALTPLTNEIGRLTTTGNSDKRISYSYDALGRHKAIEHASEGTAYVYTYQYGYPKRTLGPSDTELGTVVQSTTLPDGEIVSYGYDSGGEQQQITAGTDVIVSQILLNARGDTISVKYGNGVESEHRYNDQSNLRLNQIVSTFRPSNVVLQAYGYNFDNVGNVTQVLDYCDPDADQCPCDPSSSSCLPRRMSRAFDYDEMDRLITMKAPTGMTITGLPQSYTSDAIGNLTQKEGISQTYGANSKPHALASAGGVTYSYDPNGNLTSTSAGLAINWNGENMPTVTTKSGQKIRKQFVGEGVWKKVDGATTTLYLPQVRIENGSLRKYYGGFAERDPDAGGALRFYHDDRLGSSALVTDGTGTVKYRAAYWPYGGPDPNFSRNNTFTPKYQFNSKEPEVLSGLIDYGARMYNPAAGRWISPDTDGADGLNRYAYVSNNPVTLSDPTGHQQQGGPDFVDKPNGWESVTREPLPPGILGKRLDSWPKRSDGSSEATYDLVQAKRSAWLTLLLRPFETCKCLVWLVAAPVDPSGFLRCRLRRAEGAGLASRLANSEPWRWGSRGRGSGRQRQWPGLERNPKRWQPRRSPKELVLPLKDSKCSTAISDATTTVASFGVSTVTKFSTNWAMDPAWWVYSKRGTGGQTFFSAPPPPRKALLTTRCGTSFTGKTIPTDSRLQLHMSAMYSS